MLADFRACDTEARACKLLAHCPSEHICTPPQPGPPALFHCAGSAHARFCGGGATALWHARLRYHHASGRACCVAIQGERMSGMFDLICAGDWRFGSSTNQQMSQQAVGATLAPCPTIFQRCRAHMWTLRHLCLASAVCSLAAWHRGRAGAARCHICRRALLWNIPTC